MLNGPSSAPLVAIADDGNVILVVGPDERRLRVSSASLANASKVFSRMFGPHFSEGNSLDDVGSGPKEVHMPEDDADAMEIICSMMHFREVPDVIEPGVMLLVAIAADKFDCRTVLQYISTIWLNPKESSNLTDLAHLMAAAYLLDNRKAFSRITSAMTFRHGGSYLILTEQDVGLDSGIILKICCTFHD